MINESHHAILASGRRDEAAAVRASQFHARPFLMYRHRGALTSVAEECFHFYPLHFPVRQVTEHCSGLSSVPRAALSAMRLACSFSVRVKLVLQVGQVSVTFGAGGVRWLWKV